MGGELLSAMVLICDLHPGERDGQAATWRCPGTRGENRGWRIQRVQRMTSSHAYIQNLGTYIIMNDTRWQGK